MNFKELYPPSSNFKVPQTAKYCVDIIIGTCKDHEENHCSTKSGVRGRISGKFHSLYIFRIFNPVCTSCDVHHGNFKCVIADKMNIIPAGGTDSVPPAGTSIMTSTSAE